MYAIKGARSLNSGEGRESYGMEEIGGASDDVYGTALPSPEIPCFFERFYCHLLHSWCSSSVFFYSPLLSPHSLLKILGKQKVAACYRLPGCTFLDISPYTLFRSWKTFSFCFYESFYLFIWM